MWQSAAGPVGYVSRSRVLDDLSPPSLLSVSQTPDKNVSDEGWLHAPASHEHSGHDTRRPRLKQPSLCSSFSPPGVQPSAQLDYLYCSPSCYVTALVSSHTLTHKRTHLQVRSVYFCAHLRLEADFGPGTGGQIRLSFLLPLMCSLLIPPPPIFRRSPLWLHSRVLVSACVGSYSVV